MFLVARSINVSPIRAEELIMQHDVPAYCPKDSLLIRNRGDRHGSLRLHQKPLFPGYVFVLGSERGLQIPDRLQRKGYVVRFVTLAGKYLSLTPGDVLAVSKTEAAIYQAATERTRQTPLLKSGDAVTIIRGILSGRKVCVRDVRGRQALVQVTDRPGTSPVFVSLSDLS